MVQGWLYFLIIVVANALGAVSGMGGGVMIKPVLDFVGLDSTAAISFYATVAVLTMAFVSTIRQLQSGIQLKWQDFAPLVLGSILGGYAGNQAFEWLLSNLSEEQHVTFVQICLTVAVMLLSWGYTHWHWRTLAWPNGWGYSVVGVLLGFVASLLGIGGGPINVALLMWCFALPIKQATVYSIGIIFCSQLAKVLTIALTSGFGRYQLDLLPYIIGAGVVGGLMGAALSRRLSEQQVTVLFQWVVVGVIVLNVYNGWRLWQ